MTQMSVNTYTPNDVKLIIGGYTIVGWDTIAITKRQQGYIPVYGIRGKHTRVPSGDTSSSIVFGVVQTSPSNDVLDVIHDLDLINGTGRIEVMLKDLSGRSVFDSIDAYIPSHPEVVFSEGIEYRQWSLICQTSTWVVGGNTKPETSLVDGLLGRITSAAGNIF